MYSCLNAKHRGNYEEEWQEDNEQKPRAGVVDGGLCCCIGRVPALLVLLTSLVT